MRSHVYDEQCADYAFIRVKLPKTFLAVNLSEAFTFQEKERHNSEVDVLEMKNLEHTRSPKATAATLSNDEPAAEEPSAKAPTVPAVPEEESK